MDFTRRKLTLPTPKATSRRGPFFVLATIAISAYASAQNQPSTLTTAQTPLPPGPPTTALQAPIPSPIQKLPPAEHPLLDSPRMSSLKLYIENNPLTLSDVVAVALYTSRDMASAIASLQ